MTDVLYNVFILIARGLVKMKKCAVFNDISGFGKCSLAADLPILSAFQVEAHPFPTAVLSNQTAFESYALADISGYTDAFLNEWKKLGASFDGILTGYFVNEKQVDSVLDFIKTQNALVVVDPVMGDGGERYKGFSDELCGSIKKLCLAADVITPNETELMLLTGEADVDKAANALLSQGVGAVVLTGVEDGDCIGCTVFTKDEKHSFFAKKTGGYYSGTGDVFACALIANMLGGKDVFDSANFAVDFVSRICKSTKQCNAENGIDYEKSIFLQLE